MHAFLQTSPDDSSPWLSASEIALVRAQFARIQKDADAFAIVFYDALFSITPTVRTMFLGDMTRQGAKLMKMLATLVSGLHAPEKMTAPLVWLGLHHWSYGVLAVDYDCMGEALMRALAKQLGTAFDASARAAWSKAYSFIATNMQSARA